VVGATTPLSGPTASYGQSTELSFNGVSLKAFNAEHPNGIDGHPVKLVFLDDQGTVTGAIQAVNQLVSDKVAAVVTLSYNPEATLDEAEILAHNHIPVISGLGNTEFTNEKKYPYQFGIAPSYPQFGQAAANWTAASGFTKVAVLTDGLPADAELLSAYEAGLKKDHAKAHIVTTQMETPFATEVSAQIAGLKGANPDLVVVFTGGGYGPVWQTMQTEGLTNVKILSSPSAFYDSFTAMGPLEANAYTPYDACAPSATATYPTAVQNLYAQYSAATYGYSYNYRVYVDDDTIPFELLKYVIEKEHSDSPAAIKAGMESIHNKSFLGFDFNFTPTNHFGLRGADQAHVCQMGPPYAAGVGKIPVISASTTP
jgi:ABC-type branched-subunit amino acid transport system substrate-binding protein